MTRSLLLASVLMLGSMPAVAQGPDMFPGPNGVPCAKDTDIFARHLSQDYHEIARGIGWSTNSVMQLYLSKAGTWTVTRTIADGTTCIVMSGEGWEEIPGELPDPARKAM